MLRKLSLMLVLTIFCQLSLADQNFDDAMTKAKAGDAGSQTAVALMYSKGQGVPQDRKQAVEWLTKAAEQGYAEAQYRLGATYANGTSVPQDYKKAASWYTKAAEQGSAAGQFFLAGAHYYGHGAPQDYNQAMKLYTKAAEQGDVDAQFMLGTMYAEGQGVTQDDKQAYIWTSLAAANKSPEAIKSMDIVASKLTPAELEKAKQEAAALTQQIEQKKAAKKT